MTRAAGTDDWQPRGQMVTPPCHMCPSSTIHSLRGLRGGGGTRGSTCQAHDLSLRTAEIVPHIRRMCAEQEGEEPEVTRPQSYMRHCAPRHKALMTRHINKSRLVTADVKTRVQKDGKQAAVPGSSLQCSKKGNQQQKSILYSALKKKKTTSNVVFQRMKVSYFLFQYLIIEFA